MSDSAAPRPESGEPPTSGDMPPEEFRRHARAVVDRIADYLANVEELPVLAPVRPGEVRARIPAVAPRDGEPMEAILADFDRVFLPANTHWNHPGFFAYFSSSGSGPGILGEMLAAALNVNAMLWRTGPAPTELEEACLDWLRRALRLPETFAGEITDTASTSILYALAAARDAAMPDARARGLKGEPAGRIYCTTETHTATHKAAVTLGLGLDNVRHVRVDEALRMDPEALAAAIAEDRAAGVVPVAVVATAGTTATAAVDPLREIAMVCADAEVWLHVDAAYGGSAALAPGFEWVLDGAELADSIVVNPHKWMFVPLDCSVLLVRDRTRLARAFSVGTSYLSVPEDEAAATNLMDYGISLGRRIRALKLWFVLRWFGTRGIGARIAEHVRLAALFESWAREAEEWEVLAPRHLSLVVFRWRGSGAPDAATGSGPGNEEAEVAAAALDAANARILERVNGAGEVFLSHTALRVPGRAPVYALRLAVGNIRTREAHVARAWEALRTAAAALDGL